MRREHQHWLFGFPFLIALCVVGAIVIHGRVTDGPLTNAANIMVRTDENGYMRMSAAAAGATDGPLTAWSNLRVRTNENGHLRVTLGSDAVLTTPTLTNATVSGFLKIPAIAVAALGTCDAGAAGQIKLVTDSNTAVFNATVAAGGANIVMAFCNGSLWKVF